MMRLAGRGRKDCSLAGYRELGQAETPHVTLLFERGSPLDARVVAAIYLSRR